MRGNRKHRVHHDGRWRLGVCLACAAALLLGLGTVLAAGVATWFRGGLGVAALIMFGVGGGLLLAHLFLDQHRRFHVGPRR